MKARHLTFICSPLILVIVWGIISYGKIVDPFLVPGPLETLQTYGELFGRDSVWKDLFETTKRLGLSFGISIVIGVPLGILLGYFEKAYQFFEFLIDFFRSIPATAMFPMFLLVFGVGDTSKIAVAAFASTLVIIFNTAYGVMHAQKERILAARIMQATQLHIFRAVIFWESLPQTFVGLRNALNWALAIIIVTEMFIGTTVGLGKTIVDFQISYDLEKMYATILLAGLLGYMLNMLFVNLEKYFVHWIGK